MKRLIVQKIIFIFIFILLIDNSNEASCPENYVCALTGQTYPLNSNSYTEGNNYRPIYNYGGSFECLFCTGISKDSYYTKNAAGSCAINTCDGDKIIEMTKECTSQIVSGFFLLGDVYYCSQPENTNCKDVNNYHICSCNSYYYIEKIYGRKKYTCLNSFSSSFYTFYNYKTNELYLNECPNEYRYMKLKYNLSPVITRCSDSCEATEWVISVLDENNHMKEYCVDNCTDVSHTPNIDSSLTTYKYEFIENGKKKCLKECPSGTFAKSYDNLNKYACVPSSECLFYDSDSSSCLTTCEDNSNGKIYHKYGSNECISGCSIEDYLNENDNTCRKIDECNFIKERDTVTAPNKCLDSCADSEHFHDINSKLCLDKCGQINRYHAVDGFVCYSSCSLIPGNYIYEERDNTDDDSEPKKCYKTKPESDCEFYYKKTGGVFKCMKKIDCINKHFKYFLDSECKDNCEGYYQIELTETGTNSYTYIKCFSTLNEALNNENVIFCDNNLKKCWKEFPDNDLYFIKSKFNNQIDKYELVKNCLDNYYYLSSGSNNVPPNTKICVNNCKNIENTLPKYFDEGSYKCIDSCSDIQKYYYNEDNNKCLNSCSGQLKKFSYPIEGTNPEKCLSSCDSISVSTRGFYYNYDSFICHQYCNEDNSGYKYHKNNDNGNDPSTFICYPSCSKILDGTYKFASRDGQYMYKCTTYRPSIGCVYFYTLEDGMIQCATALDCKNKNYFYFIGDECMINCDSSYYKLEIKLPIDDSQTIFETFKRCFRTPEECLTGFTTTLTKIFFHQDSKMCWEKYQENYFIKSFDTNKYELIEACDHYYYVSNLDGDPVKYCTQSCYTPMTTNLELYFLNGKKNCENSCTIFSKYYYDPRNHECLDTCSGLQNLEFVLPLENNQPQECINKCQNYFITKTGSDPNIKIKECINSCPSGIYKFLDIKTYECLEECSSDTYYIIDNNCYRKCSQASNKVYINTDTYDCVLACPSELKNIVKLGTVDSTDIFMCKSQCGENNKYRLGDECLEKCPIDHNFIGFNNICKNACTADSNGEYYYPINEFENPTPEYTIYKCVSSCALAKIPDSNREGGFLNYFFFFKELESKECFWECPPESPFYLGSNPYECLIECPYNSPYYNINAQEHKYLCKESSNCINGDKIYFFEGQCLTLAECISSPYYKRFVDWRNICLDKCQDNEIKQKFDNYDNVYQCLPNCGNDKFILKYGSNNEGECVSFCPKEKNFIGRDNVCKRFCGESDGIYYYKIDEKPISNLSPDYIYYIYKCVDGCKEANDGYRYKEVNNGNQCYKECTTNFPYLSLEENLCYDNCLKSIENPFSLPMPNNFRCSKKCEENGDYKFWGENKVCIKNCSELGDAKIADYNNKCVEKCNITSQYPFELEGSCVESCDISPEKKRYSKTDYKCKTKCAENEYLINENECSTVCNFFKLSIETGEQKCVPSCPGEYPFYYPSDNICLDKCKDNDKVVEDQKICVNNCNELNSENKVYFLYESIGITDLYHKHHMCLLKCPENKKYIYQGECIEKCPEDHKYFIDSSINKYCLNDCPENYPYYIIQKESISTQSIYLYKCIAECPDFFVPNNNEPSKIAKLCLKNCPDDEQLDYKYKIVETIDYVTVKKCYEKCPDDAKYYFKEISIPPYDNNCYKECPPENKAPYHIKGDTICLKIDELIGGFILYDIKEWTNLINKCPEKYNFFSIVTINNIDLTVCLDKCDFEYFDSFNNEYIKYEYSTYEKQCVKANDCESINVLQGERLVSNEELKKCICPNFFYIDASSRMICLENCKNNEYYPNLKSLYGTSQCLQTCEDKILNPSEDKCYEKNMICADIQANTKLIQKGNSQKCDCMYKFYFDGDEKVCLSEDSVCPFDYSLLIIETQECIRECPQNIFKYKFQNYCLRSCPIGCPDVNNDFICDRENKFWYQLSDGNFQCLSGDCLEDYPVYINETKQCVKTCKGTLYNYFYNNKCYASCSGIENTIPKNIDSPIAEYECACDRPWYLYNNNEMKCPPINTNIKKCKDYNMNLDFKIDENNQCVKECPKNYIYYFNNVCYSSCEYAKEKHIINIETVSNSHECKCQNLWHIEPDDIYQDIKCYEENIIECPPYYEYNINEIKNKSSSYLIFNTKQCVNNINQCPPNSYTFNHICYDRCPEFTLEKNGQDKTCICNTCNNCNAQKKKSYLWLEYEKYGNIYYQCGLNSCPEEFTDGQNTYIRKNYLENENKCVLNCSEDKSGVYIYSFRNRCVKKCPSLTETKYDTCEFYDLEGDNIDSLDALKEAANIQAKELYDKSDHLSGFLMNKFDASLQIYSTDRFNTYKELSMKSNLTYIDLGTCREKIYADYNLADNDKILIAKYDLLNRKNIPKDNKFLINQVEYEFYLERTMEKIEGSICSPYEIVISYPISINKNKFNNFENGLNDNKYLKLFKIGKELNEKNPEIDIFNKDNKVYKDICSGLELDGKDLVFEDRYDNLYPNNISLCESNCTMNNTDYKLERINCMCTYKEVFDFYRTDEDNNDILNDPNFVKPTQSKSNMEIMKCLSKLNMKEDLLKNEAFYASSAITVVEIISVIASALKGIKTISSFAKGLINMKGVGNPPRKGENNNEINFNDLVEIRKKNVINKKNLIINNTPGTMNSKNSVSELRSSNRLYNININSFSNKKADFIPPKYNFKFFRSNDKGVIKRIKRSQIPFKINPDIKLLLEAKSGVMYDKNYLKGPYYEDQNIIEIIEDNNIKYIDEDLSDRSNIVINKNYNKNNGMFKEESYKPNKGEKDFIKITKKNPINNFDMSITLYKKEKEKENKLYNMVNIYTLIKREHTYLRSDYNSYIAKSHPNIFATILAEIFDKIYFIKIFIFLKKFELTSIHLSLYLFYHIFLLSLLCGFFTINTIKRIWNEDDFPNITFYLLYGLITHIIVWVIYKIFIVLLDNQDQFMKLSLLNKENRANKALRVNTNKNSNDIEVETYNDQIQKNIEEKYEEIIKKIKIQTIIFYVVIILLTEFCSAYLISFFAVYTGTKKYVLKTYYISIIEIVIIKVVYGLSLGSLRITSEVNEYDSLYNFVYFCDKYIS